MCVPFHSVERERGRERDGERESDRGRKRERESGKGTLRRWRVAIRSMMCVPFYA